MKLQRVSPVFVSLDVPRALAEYESLGFTCDAYDEGNETVYGFMRWDDVELHVSRVPFIDLKKTNACCYLYVDDADALYRKWRDASPPGVLHTPQDTQYGLREFGYVDSDGNLVRVGSPLGSKTQEPGR